MVTLDRRGVLSVFVFGEADEDLDKKESEVRWMANYQIKLLGTLN
jgi:hypothetical protein